MNETVNKLPPEVKEEWLKRLRSGQYKQGTASLRTETDEFCCLGVLCDIYAERVPNSFQWTLDEDAKAYHFGKFFGFPPDAVTKWAADALTQHLPVKGRSVKLTEIGYGNSEISLIAMNDYGATFEEIANIIEEEL